MNEDWKTPQHRRKIVEQIERKIQNPNKAREVEKASFSKAKTKEEYFIMVKNLLTHITGAKKENMVNMQQTTAGHNNVQDAMMAMQNLPNRGQGLAGNQQQQLQMGQPGMPGIQQTLQGQQQHINIQQNQLNLMRQKQLQQQQHTLQMHMNQQQQQQSVPIQQQQQPGMPQFNPNNMNQPQQIIRTAANFVSPTGQPPQNPMAPPAAPVFPGQPTPPQHQPGMVPSPAYAQQMSPAGQQPGSQPVLSPATYMQPSPTNQQSMPSPMQRGGVPSPSTSLNTPGNPSSVGSVPSPGSAGRGPGSIGPHPSQEEQVQLREKQRQLALYMEQMKKQITFAKDQGDIAKAQKVAHFVQHLSEIKNDLARISQRLHQLSKSSGMPLLNAITEQINSPHLNHNLQKAFSPALNKLHGTPSSFTAPILKKPPTDSSSSQGVPDVVQGEVARLPPKFRVALDPGHLPDSDSVHLLCKLEDEYLPSVPPVCVVIPEKYPSVNPQYNVNAFYCQTPFHQLVHKMLLTQLTHMPDLYTFTQLMDAWEMSVRKCCQAF
ncbi:putative mediator of RNA polymerase II transcription subunit 15 isoform X3 [Apostichopus japonicus]|uniref:Mediator of RNA polymerase II transcription subunit 15 n=1 Tax=Stichopus japonicus TaxID=307972 RepID=A0A2G8JMY0_STIJA|nr:putative mediator of RNA polymerase II transcription subunit 15 isoform X3 [Apostichopus japonicus]